MTEPRERTRDDTPDAEDVEQERKQVRAREVVAPSEPSRGMRNDDPKGQPPPRKPPRK